MLQRIFRDTRGVSSAEYALILAILGAGVAGAAYSLGGTEAEAINRGAAIVAADPAAAADGSSGAGSSVGQNNGNAGANGLTNAPGQNPSPGNGHSNGNQTPGSPPTSPPGKNK